MGATLKEAFGDIDIYLFDQLLKGRFDGCKKVLDAGCGHGRNLVWLLRNQYEVYGIDQDAGSIAAVRKVAARLAPGLPETNFSVGVLEALPYPDAAFDLVLCSAVLHFARDDRHFGEMLEAMWRVLRPGGFFFARLASDIGIEHLVTPLGNGRYHLPDGSDRFLVNVQTLIRYTDSLNGTLVEYIKTTNVQNLRCMTTWCLRKD